ncbi:MULTISPECIES: hypothetical protein [Streptomyces]|uniref:hypothetical protein n=1 Tax=Streptomyces TaxID=1883 RepID=UPI0002F9870D|nr:MULTISPECIES: hypothetical protein [Streptomyces]WTD23125.1 hypothetical protein OH737_00600 [Streptomyces anulatus]
MTRVRAHRRADGTHVKAHNRRTRPRAGTPTAAPRRTSARPSAAPNVPAPAGPTTRVRSYRRADGTHVRGHHRTLPPGTAVVGTGIGGLLIFFLILAALAPGGGENSPGKDVGPSAPAAVAPAGPAPSR